MSERVCMGAEWSPHTLIKSFDYLRGTVQFVLSMELHAMTPFSSDSLPLSPSISVPSVHLFFPSPKQLGEAEGEKRNV